MEEAVVRLMELVGGTFHWGIDNALPLVVGALLGSHLIRAGVGLVSDVLGRAKGLLDDATSLLAGKK